MVNIFEEFERHVARPVGRDVTNFFEKDLPEFGRDFEKGADEFGGDVDDFFNGRGDAHRDLTNAVEDAKQGVTDAAQWAYRESGLEGVVNNASFQANARELATAALLAHRDLIERAQTLASSLLADPQNVQQITSLAQRTARRELTGAEMRSSADALRIRLFGAGDDGSADASAHTREAATVAVVATDVALANDEHGHVCAVASAATGRVALARQAAHGGPIGDWVVVGGGRTIGRPAVAPSADGRLEIVARGIDNALWHTWQSGEQRNWAAWVNRGGVIDGPPSSVPDSRGRLRTFARGSDHGLWLIPQLAPNGAWGGWESLGGELRSPPTAVRHGSGPILVFARGTDDALWYRSESTSTDAWDDWKSLGGQLTSGVFASRGADGGVDVFVRGADRGVWTRRLDGSATQWSEWSSLGGGLTPTVAVGPNEDGRLGIFVRGDDDALWHKWQTTSGGWSDWLSLGGRLVGEPTVLLGGDGHQVVVAAGTGGELHQIRQQVPNGAWGSWAPVSGAGKV